MKGTVFTDTSYFQNYLDARYKHHWVSFRASDGTFRDPKFAGNLAAAQKLARAGHLEGYTVYTVYRPGIDIVAVVKALVGTPDHHITVMIDVESWGGQIGGDHHAEITALADRFADWLGSRKRVLVYGNLGDLDRLDAHRPGWLRSIVAGYSSTQPAVKHMVGWQYSDGSTRWARPRTGLRLLPRRSRPFGACDHNVFPGVARTDLAKAFDLGPTKPPVKPTPKPPAKHHPGHHDPLAVIAELDGAPKHLTYREFVDDLATALKAKGA